MIFRFSSVTLDFQCGDVKERINQDIPKIREWTCFLPIEAHGVINLFFSFQNATQVFWVIVHFRRGVQKPSRQVTIEQIPALQLPGLSFPL